VIGIDAEVVVRIADDAGRLGGAGAGGLIWIRIEICVGVLDVAERASGIVCRAGTAVVGVRSAIADDLGVIDLS